MAKKPVEGPERMEVRPHTNPATGEVQPWRHRVGSNKSKSSASRKDTRELGEGLMGLTTSDESVDPVDVDTQLAEAYMEEMKAKSRIASLIDQFHDMAGDRKTRVGRDYIRQMTFDEVMEKGTRVPYLVPQWEKNLVELEQLNEKVETAQQQSYELNRVWEENGRWSRFFLVRNTGGHIHSSMACSTCYPTTEFAWLPEISGQTEAEAVENYGGILCSVCFPSAPTEWTEGESKADKDAREKREREKQERQAAKLAKSLTLTGEPLRLPDTRDVLKTVRSAEIWLSDSYEDFYGKNDERHKGDRELVFDALEKKTGKSRDELMAETMKRVAARKKRSR